MMSDSQDESPPPVPAAELVMQTDFDPSELRDQLPSSLNNARMGDGVRGQAKSS